MKKRIAMLICMMIVMISFAGCSTRDVVGKWEMVSLTYGGERMTVDQFAEYMGQYLSTTFEFHPDGTCKYTVSGGGESYFMSGTWEKTGDGELVIYLDGDTCWARMDGGTLMFFDGYDEVYFEKKGAGLRLV